MRVYPAVDDLGGFRAGLDAFSSNGCTRKQINKLRLRAHIFLSNQRTEKKYGFLYFNTFNETFKSIKQGKLLVKKMKAILFDEST